jgi:hypothetical protein
VVSADIIEYGIPLIEKILSENPTGSVNLSVNKLGDLKLFVGQEVKFKYYDNTTVEALVIGYKTSNNSYQLQLKHESISKTVSVLPGSYRRIILDQKN